MKTRGYTQIYPAYSQQFYYSTHAIEHSCNFTGPSKIGVNMSGRGSIFMTENIKGLSAYLVTTSGSSSATFKWGFDDNVIWSWIVRYSGADRFDTATLDFTGYYEYVNPDTNPFSHLFMNELPMHITADHVLIDGYRYLEVNMNDGHAFYKYKMSIYEQHNNQYGNSDYILLGEKENIPGDITTHFTCPPDSSYCFIVYRTHKDYTGKITHDYIGDRLFYGASLPWEWWARTTDKK